MVEIVSCLIGPDNYGVTCADHTTKHITVYKDKLSNIVGFRRYLPYHNVANNHQYIEVNHFLNMLYEGSRLAMEVLMCPKEYIIEDSHDFQMIKDIYCQFVTKKLVMDLLEESKKLSKQIDKESSLATITTTSIKIIEYDKYAAYQCILNLSLIKDILKDGEFKNKRDDFLTLEAIREGRFKYETVKKQINSLTEEVEESVKKSAIKEEPNKIIINDILLKIRNVANGTR
jgi:hypothetical protein